MKFAVSARRFGVNPLALVALAAISLTFIGSGRSGHAQRPTKIGYVDVDLVTMRSQSIRRAVKTAEDQQRKLAEELEIDIRELQRMRSDLSARRSVLSAEEIRREETKNEAVRDRIDLKNLAIEKHLRETRTKVMEPAIDRILATVDKVGKANGFDLVLRSDVVLFGVDALDITSLVIQELDRPGPRSATPALPDPGRGR